MSGRRSGPQPRPSPMRDGESEPAPVAGPTTMRVREADNSRLQFSLPTRSNNPHRRNGMCYLPAGLPVVLNLVGGLARTEGQARCWRYLGNY